MSLPKVIIDTERMKYPFTGLYYYCKDLAVNMSKYYHNHYDLYFYTPSKINALQHLKRIFIKPIDKYIFLLSKKFDLYHITWQDSKYVPFNAIKIVYTVHDLNFLYTEKPEFKKKKLLRNIQHKFDRANAVTAISDYVKNDVIKHINTRGKEITVIHNGVDFKEFNEFDSPSYRPEKPFLFTVGTVLYKKNFHVLPQLLLDNDYELLIAGIHSNKSYLHFLQHEIENLGLSQRVKLLGTISDEEKYWYNKHCLAFVFPSLSEGFGIPPIEAMKHGKPVFLSTHTSLPEIGGSSAYYFTSFDGDAMRSVFKKGLEDYSSHNRSSSIIEWANRYSWETSIKKYAEVYNKVLGIQQSTVDVSKFSVKITTIIPTLNEQENIEQAIQSVLFADEIIIIDSFSNDKTLEIARRYPVKILQRKFDDFSSQKNYALQFATHDWILFLDADERIPLDLQQEIIATIQNNPQEKVFRFKMDYYFLDQKMRFGGFQSKYVFRLFDRKSAHFEGVVHEKLVAEGNFITLKNHIVHQDLQGLEEFIKTQEHYAFLKAQDRVHSSPRWNFPVKYLKAAYRFIFHYFIRLGIFDGKAGFKFAQIQAYGMQKKYDIHTELYQQHQEIGLITKYLHQAQVILYPTDTVWGLGCDATNAEAVEKIFQIKKRDDSKSLVILVSSVKMLEEYVGTVPNEVLNYLNSVQKPTTVIFDNVKGLVDKVIAPDQTVGIRIASDYFCKNLIETFGKPIVSTSANISGEPSPKNFTEIAEIIKSKADYVVHYRREDISEHEPSAIVKVMNNDIQIIRS